MKKFIYIFVASFLTFSCANSNKEASVSDIEFSENEVVGNSNKDLGEATTFTNSQLAEVKLQDYFELLTLSQKHPEFKEEIRSQIQSLSESNLTISESLDIISVENLRQAGAVLQLGDSLQKIKFYFNVITENGVREDSITAVLRAQKVTIEQQEIMSTKVTFEKN